MDKNLLILTEAGEGIGFGHLMRCSAVQTSLMRNSIKSLMLLNVAGNDAAFNQEKIEIADWLNDLSILKGFSKRFHTVFVDSYLADSEQYSFISSLFQSVIAFDDYNRIVYPSDLIINPNLFADRIDYTNQNARVIGGSEYVVLRPAFTEKDQDFTVRNQLRNILITLGGSDYRGLIPTILNLIKKEGYAISIVAGTESYRRELEQYSGEYCRIFGYMESTEMALLMLDADIVISAAGQTLHELAYFGVPTIAICIDDDQQLNMTSYFENGFLAEELYWNDPDLCNRIQELLLKLQHSDLRQKLSSIGKKLIDGKGTQRIYDVFRKSDFIDV